MWYTLEPKIVKKKKCGIHSELKKSKKKKCGIQDFEIYAGVTQKKKCGIHSCPNESKKNVVYTRGLKKKKSGRNSKK